MLDGLRRPRPRRVARELRAAASYYPIHAYGWRDGADRLTWVRYVFAAAAVTKAG